MKNPRRVVITGLGVIAPNGIGKDTFWQNLVAGKSGIDYITAFDPSSHSCHVAAEVKDFHPSDFINSRRLKNMSRFSQLAVAAARLALEDSGRRGVPDNLAICFGTSVSGLEVAVDGVQEF